MSVGTVGTGCPHATAAAGHGGSESGGGETRGCHPRSHRRARGGHKQTPGACSTATGTQRLSLSPALPPPHSQPQQRGTGAPRGAPTLGALWSCWAGEEEEEAGGRKAEHRPVKELRQQEGEGPSERHSAVQDYRCSLLPAIISSISPTGGNPQPRHPLVTAPAAPGVPGCDAN